MAASRGYDLPPVWALECGVVGYLLSKYYPVWSFNDQVPNMLGAAVAALGLALILWAALWFRRQKTTIHPNSTPQHLVAEGPYKISRNPMYLGMAVILIGASLWFGAVSSFATVIFFVYIVNKRFISWEEAKLRETFGAEAEVYFGQTRRWL